jgi:hypothetical protein
VSAKTPELDSLNQIARDAASYAEGAGEPEFSHFLQLELRLLKCIRVKASLEPCTNALADALEAVLADFAVMNAEPLHIDEAHAALRLAGRLP